MTKDRDNLKSSLQSKKQEDIPAAVYAGLESGSSFIQNVQKLTIEELIELYAYAEAIVETVREPLIVLDKDLTVKSVNRVFKYIQSKRKRNYRKKDI